LSLVAAFQHAVFPQEALNATFGVDNFLRAGEKGMVPRPNIYVKFWFGGTNGHYDLSVAVNFSFGVPLGVNIRFCHFLSLLN
jgi:hypothetical protein